MTRILITGAEGGLGRAWARRLGVAGLSLEPAFKGPVEVIACPKGKLDVTSLTTLRMSWTRPRPTSS